MKLKLLIIAIGLLLPSAIFAGEKTAFTSPNLSAQVSTYGGIENLKVGNQVVFRKLFLYGSYAIAPDEKQHDTRFFQNMDQTPCKITRPDSRTMVIEKLQSKLGNKQYPDALVYDQKVTLTPTSMTAEYIVKTNVPLASQMNLFLSLMELPLSLCGRGYKAHALNGKQIMAVIPQSYEPDQPLRLLADELSIAVDGGVLKFTCSSDSQMSFYDGRSWKADHLRLDIAPRINWHEKPVIYPADSSFHWTFTITFVPLDED
jgi:hypothetical protein